MRNLIASAVLMVVVAVSGCGQGLEDEGADQVQPADVETVASMVDMVDEDECHDLGPIPDEDSAADEWGPAATPQR